MSDDSTARHLAQNLRDLRRLSNLTQARLAEASGVPRATIATLETGAANPTLAVLVALGRALRVTLDELVGPPRSVGRVVRVSQLPEARRGRVVVRELLPEPLPGLLLERLALAPRARMSGTPHAAGTREYLACESGRVELWASGECFALEPGDVAVFRGDQRHSYGNPHDEPAVAYSAVVVAG